MHIIHKVLVHSFINSNAKYGLTTFMYWANGHIVLLCQTIKYEEMNFSYSIPRQNREIKCKQYFSE